MSSETRSYPRRVKTDAGEIEFRLMSRADEAAVLDFAQKLPTHDLLFLPRNISQPKVLSAWIKEIERGAITSLLAVKAGRVVGCGTLVRDPHSWSPHVGEIRNGGLAGRARPGGRPGAVAGDVCAGAGRRPGKAVGADDGRPDRRDRDCSKASASRPKRCCATMSGTSTGKKHDIVVLGHNVAQVRAQMEAYGLPGARVQH